MVSRGTLAKEIAADLKMLHQRIGIETLRARVDMAATDTQVGQRLERRKRIVEILLVNAKLRRFASHVEPEAARNTSPAAAARRSSAAYRSVGRDIGFAN